jgi:SAM-dependent methyltransferase
MTTDTHDSAAWYDQHVAEYASRTDAVDLSNEYDRFLAYLRPHAHILDAGCGPGRDSAAFLARGYRITALDASIEMVALASQRLEQHVHHLRHQEVTFDRAFDGVWANATLLHVPLAELHLVLRNYRRALVPGGVLFASFKHGSGEEERDGRFFIDQTGESFRDIVATIPGLALAETWISHDRRPGREREAWLNTLSRTEW